MPRPTKTTARDRAVLDHLRLIRNIAHKYRVADRTHEDLVQDAICYICARWHEFDRKRGRLAAWIGSMTRHGIVEALRREGTGVIRITRSPRRPNGPLSAPSCSIDSPLPGGGERQFPARDRSAAVEAADELAAILDRLPDRQRACVELTMASYTSREIAGFLRVSASTVQDDIKAAARAGADSNGG